MDSHGTGLGLVLLGFSLHGRVGVSRPAACKGVWNWHGEQVHAAAWWRLQRCLACRAATLVQATLASRRLVGHQTHFKALGLMI